jgi:hypothetical protein
MKELKTKSCVGACLGAAAAAVLVPLAVAQVGTAGATGVSHQQQQQGGPVTIQSWVYTALSENNLSATAWQCTKISGAITDESGGPTWQSDQQYAYPTTLAPLSAAAVSAATAECANKVPAGGVVLVPAPEPGQYLFGPSTANPTATSPDQYTGLATFYSQQTIDGQKGTIVFTIASTYNLTDNPVKVGNVEIPPYRTGPDATWVITGGTGAYADLRGNGTWDGDASTIPWCYRLATGKVWYTDSAANA